MPCSCFGKKDKKGEEVAEKYRPRDSKSRERESPPPPAPAPAPEPATPPPAPVTPTPSGDSRLRPEDDPDKANRRRDVVASFYSDQCELIGFKATGSRPPSTHVGSSQDGPAATSSPAASSPGSTRSGASCRADLAEKRREFFKELAVEDDDSSRSGSRPTSRMTDPGFQTTPRNSHYQEHHYSLPHQSKTISRTFKYSLPFTSVRSSNNAAATVSEETQPLLEPSLEHAAEGDDEPEKKPTNHIPQESTDEPDHSGKPSVVKSCDLPVTEPSRDSQRQVVDHLVEGSSALHQNQSTQETTQQSLLERSLESEQLIDLSVSKSPEKNVDYLDISVCESLEKSVEPVDKAVFESSEKHVEPVTESSDTCVKSVSESSESRVELENKTVEKREEFVFERPEKRIDEHLSDSTPLIEDSSASESTTVFKGTFAPERVETLVDVPAAEHPAQLRVEQQYVQQTSVQSDDERAAEGSCILINEAFSVQVREPPEMIFHERNELISDDSAHETSQSPEHEFCQEISYAYEDETPQRIHQLPLDSIQETSRIYTDEVHQEVAEQSIVQPVLLENSQENTYVLGIAQEHRPPTVQGAVQPAAEETTLNSHCELLHHSLPPTFDSCFLTSAEEPEELLTEQSLHQSVSQRSENPASNEWSHLSEVSSHQPKEVKSTVEIVDCIPKVPQVEAVHTPSTLPPQDTSDAPAPLSMTLATRHDEDETLPPAPPTPPVDDEPLPPPPPTPPAEDKPLPPAPPTPPADDEPLPPAPPTPPISSEPRLPPATCSLDHVSSSSVLEDDGLGSEIDDALSSLECLSEEGNSNERAAASS